MEIIVSALNCEIAPLKKFFGKSVKFFTCGVRAKKLEFIKNLNENDHLINVGVCGGIEIGNLYLCNKIIGQKNYFPDILSSANIEQRAIKTQEKLADSKTIKDNPKLLYDQEAAIIYNEAIKYIGPHQMSFLKIISDDGSNTNNITKDYVAQLIGSKTEDIAKYIEHHKDFFRNTKNLDISKYSKILKATTTMENRLAHQIRYAKIIGANVDKFFDNLPQVQNKKDSLKALDCFDEFLIKQTN